MTKKDEKLIKEIYRITDKGNNAEVKRNTDGSYSVYDVSKKKKTVG